MRLSSKLIVAATLLIQTYFSQALAVNLLTNGSFESVTFDGNWTYKTNQADVAGWTWSDGSAMEFWNTPFLGVNAVDGTVIAELNAHGGNGGYNFYQTFATVAGQSYDYSFSYRARSDENEQFHLGITRFFDDDSTDLITNTIYDNHTTSQWKLAQGSFVATGSTSQIGFWSDDNPSDTVGNLLDDVVVTTSVTEPASLALLGLGLLALGVSRSRIKAQ
jgi:hypothetical protein